MNIAPTDLDQYMSLPTEIKKNFVGAEVTVVKDKSRSTVYHMKGTDQDYFLKVTPKDQMNSEAIMTAYLSHFGKSPKVMQYISNETNDFLVTEGLPGIDAARGVHLKHPERLTEVFAESLWRLHQVPIKDCPITNGLEEMFIRAEGKYHEGKVEYGLLTYLGYTDIKVAYSDMKSLFKSAEKERIVIHGDYCLPNVILQDFNLTGFVDVGYGGIGDRNYDIFWGLWSLQFNLKSKEFSNLFMNAYGSHFIDQERLHLCGLLSAFNGFRGQDYYETADKQKEK